MTATFGEAHEYVPDSCTHPRAACGAAVIGVALDDCPYHVQAIAEEWATIVHRPPHCRSKQGTTTGGAMDAGEVPARPDATAVEPLDMFTVLMLAQGVTVEPCKATVYTCTDCGCLFAPDSDRSGIHPERAVMVGADGFPRCTEEECPCHQVPCQTPVPPGRAASS